jgi:hypothetical protein
MASLDDVLLPVFATQHWLVSLDDVRRAGGTRQQAAHRLATGRWEAADARVYRLVGVAASWHSRLLAPVLSAGELAAASHFAAAVLHEIPGFGRGAPELTIPRGATYRRDDVRAHTSTDLRRSSPVTIAGIPATSFDRTLLDLARTVKDARLLRAIEFGRRTKATDWSSLATTLRIHARRGRPGIARLRRVITENIHRSEVTDSDFELLAIALILERGLPEPVLHHRVMDGERFVAEVDLAYPELKIAIELDGAIHLERNVRERDLPRQNDLVLAGWTVLRFTWDRLVLRPDSIIAEIRAARAAALRSITD